MSVIGFDIGNLNCFVAVARSGGIETIANDYSDRCTPAVVAFNEVQRLAGVGAKNQTTMNLKNTVTQIKRLIGHKYDEAYSQAELPNLPYRTTKLPNGDIGIQVRYRNEEKVFTPVQILAMLLSHLRDTTSAALQTKILDCVISVPAYFTDIQRRAVLHSSKIVGLNCLKLMNETTAVGLGYGLFKQDLPAPEEKPRNVAFVDMGHASLQVSIAEFNKGKMKVLSTASDPCLGGRDFDNKLANHFNEEFKVKYKIDAKSNPKAWSRLLTAVEKLKKQLSANTVELPFFIECFMDDKDVSSKIDRETFEKMSQDLLERLQAPMLTALNDAKLKPEDVESVEIVGGTTRTPALKVTIEQVFGKSPRTTLNQDEAVARGCAVQCAMLSHTVRVRDFEILDAVQYPINISWDPVKPGADPGEMEVFKQNHAYPFTKLLTFPHRTEPFCFKAFYRNDVAIPHLDREIGDFIVNAGAATDSSVEKIKVKVKLRVDKNGCFSVCSATMVETLPQSETPIEEPMETDTSTPVVNGDNKENNDKPAESAETPSKTEEEQKGQDQAKKSPEEATTDKKEDKSDDVKKPEAKKAKKLTKSTDLKIDPIQTGLTAEDIANLVSIEQELQFHARVEKERADAKNNLEEYIYAMRDKLSGDLENYVEEGQRDEFSVQLEDGESWLYGDGEDLQKQAYIDKLEGLKKISQPMEDRCVAHQAIPGAIDNFGKAMTHYKKILEQYENKDEKYVHIEAEEMKKVKNKVEEKFNWFNEKLNEMGKCPKTKNPPVYPSQIETEKKLMQTFCDPIVNKPKPKVEPPKDEPKKEGEEGAKPEETKNEKTTEQPQTTENMETDTPKPEGKSEDLGMEVD